MKKLEPLNPVEVNGEIYLNASDSARHLGIKRGIFYLRVKNQLTSCKVGFCGRQMYKLTELNALLQSVEEKAS